MNMVKRLSIKSLTDIVNGKAYSNSTCVIKFYSNGCHFCHGLRRPYQMVAEDFFLEDRRAHFFAFNIDDIHDLEQIVQINGVPTIMVVKTKLNKPTIYLMPEPPDGQQNSKSWYPFQDLYKFIKGHAS